MARPTAPVVVAITLPLLLALAVAGIAITERAGGFDPAPVVEAGPLAVPPIDAPAAGGPQCAAVVRALPTQLHADDRTLDARPLTQPAPPGTRAWAAPGRPIVLRCGLPRPSELTPTSELLVVDRVQWLRLDDGIPDPVVVTYVTVDRPVYVAVTLPVALGPAPVQEISDVLRTTLPETPVQVR